MYYVFVLKTVSELDEDPRPYQLDHVRTGALGTKGRSTSERLKQTQSGARLPRSIPSYQLVSSFISLCLSFPHL